MLEFGEHKSTKDGRQQTLIVSALGRLAVFLFLPAACVVYWALENVDCVVIWTILLDIC